MQIPTASRKIKPVDGFVFQVLRQMDCQGFPFICKKLRPFHVSFLPTCSLIRISLWLLFDNSDFSGRCDCFADFHFCQAAGLFIYFSNIYETVSYAGHSARW